jgi:LytS/YehU family sensor histidine kinase
VTVRVEAARNGDDLLVMVEDDGTADPGEVRPGTGVGIGNVRQRLHVLFGPRGTLETMKRERGFVAIVRLPLSRRVANFARVA